MTFKPGPRTALVTHRNCLDGSGCAAVFVWAGGDSKNIFFRDPRKCALSAEEAAPFDEVWFADVCPPDLTDPAGGKPWLVFDHHETNINRHEGNPNCNFNRGYCGTSLLARFLAVRDSEHQGRQRCIAAIEHHDLGRFNASDDVMYIANLAVCKSQDSMVTLLSHLGDDIFSDNDYLQQSRAICDYHDILAEKCASVAYGAEYEHPTDGPVWVAITSGPHLCVNTIANRVLDGRAIGGKVPAIAVVVAYDANSVSLRTRSASAPNVARIAELYNGGGHPAAAGFGLDRRAMKRLFELVFS